MLRYRSATFLIRLYCPEVMVSVPAMIEVESGGDYRDITPVQAQVAEPDPKPAAAKKPAAKPKADANPAPAAKDVQEAEVVEEEVVEGAAPQPAAETENAQVDERFENTYRMIKNDFELCTADTIDEVLTLYESHFSEMESAAPELHKIIMAEVADIKASAG